MKFYSISRILSLLVLGTSLVSARVVFQEERANPDQDQYQSNYQTQNQYQNQNYEPMDYNGGYHHETQAPYHQEQPAYHQEQPSYHQEQPAYHQQPSEEPQYYPQATQEPSYYQPQAGSYQEPAQNAPTQRFPSQPTSLDKINPASLTPEQRSVLSELMSAAKSESQVQGRSFGYISHKLNNLWVKFLSLFPGLYLDYDPYTNSLWETMPFLKRVQTPVVYKQESPYGGSGYKFPIFGGVMKFFGDIKQKLFHKASPTTYYKSNQHSSEYSTNSGSYFSQSPLPSSEYGSSHSRRRRAIEEETRGEGEGRTLSVVNSFFNRLLSRPAPTPHQTQFSTQSADQFLNQGFEKSGEKPAETRQRPEIRFSNLMTELPALMNRILYRVQRDENSPPTQSSIVNPFGQFLRRILPYRTTRNAYY